MVTTVGACEELFMGFSGDPSILQVLLSKVGSYRIQLQEREGVKQRLPPSFQYALDIFFFPWPLVCVVSEMLSVSSPFSLYSYLLTYEIPGVCVCVNVCVSVRYVTNCM